MTMHPLSKGFFITLEGGEGSGKSTLLNHLTDFLKHQGYHVITTREPGGTALGETIRNWLLTNHSTFNIGSKAELFLFLAARAQHIEEVIIPALNDGKIVLCDRFNDSTIAYQGAARGLEMKYVQRLCNLVCGDIQPHLTLFLDVDPTIGLVRTQKLSKEHAISGQFDRIESQTLEFHKQVQEAFQKIARREPLRVYKINANQPQSSVFNEAVKAIEELILLPADKSPS
jgi:dTMP kinase